MENKVKINIKYFLGKEKSKEILLKLSKDAHIEAATEELDLADMETYSIFKPLLSPIGITRNDYMSNHRLRNNYRQLLFSLYKERTKQLNDQKEKNIDIDEFGRTIHDITVSWYKLFSATGEKKDETNTGQYISGLSLKEFCQLDEDARKKLLKISSEEKFPLDYEIYKAFNKELEITKDVNFLEFIQNEELKEDYRHKLSFVKEALSHQNNAKVTDKEALERITHESKNWCEFIEAAEIVLPNGKEIFTSVQPLETFALLTDADKKALEDKLARIPIERRIMKNKKKDSDDDWIQTFVNVSKQKEDTKAVKR